jgi:hypothetical protein
MDEQEVICPRSTRQEMMVNIDADFIVAGGSAGSSKTYSALMRSLRYIDDPNYRAVYFRRETTQVKGQGGLWQEAKQLYKAFGGHAKERDLTITFPSGAEIRFFHMEHEKNAEDHSGLVCSPTIQ